MSDVTIKQLAKVLGTPIDKLLAQLAEAGMKFTDPEQVISSTEKVKLLGIEGFDEDIVEELRARARDALLTDALQVEEDIEDHKPADDLVAVEGLDEEVAFALAQHGVITRENLADLATDELMEFGIEGLDAEKASALIMAAREAVSS